MSYTWDTTINNWLESVKSEGAYDSIGNLILDSRYTWDSATNSWKGSYKYEFNFDSNGNYTVRMSYAWDSNNNSWQLSGISSFFYSSKNISILNNPTLMNVYLFPNPAKDEFQISGLTENSRITLFDLNGKSLINKDVINNEPISISTLKKGIYLVNFTSSDGNHASLLLKK